MGKPWFFAKINMKRKIRNTIIAFTLITSILCGNLFVSPVYAEEIENTADNVETLTLAEEETELQEEITEAENPDVDTVEEQENTDESVDEIEEDEKTDETDEIDETDETEKTDAVEDIPKESIIPEEIPSATETPVPTPEIEIKEDEEQIISVVKSDIDSDVYADAVAMVEEKYTGKTLADAFELSVPENTEFPVTITFSANIKADDNALLLQYTNSEWTEIVIDAVEDGSITATFDFLGSIIVLKDEIEEVVEEDQIIEETLPLSYEKSIDNIEVSVSADAGVFPSGSTVLINKVNVSENIFTEENIQETYSFDITVVCNGEEVQPDTSEGNVTVSFAQIEIASDATVDVYHVTENLQATSEKIQNVEVNDDNVSFEVEHFSVYTVIVSTKIDNSKPYYVNLSYALGEKIPLTEILDAAGVDYSDYVYVNGYAYSADMEGQEYSSSLKPFTYLYGTIEESYMIFKEEGCSWEYLYIYKNDKSTKKSIALYINIQNTTTHDFQLGENVYADFDETTGHLDITGIGNMWGSHCNNIVAPIADKITSISIAEGITSIGDTLFYNCTNIKGNLVIPNSVTSIGGSAFYGCSGLTGDLVIPNSVISIGSYAFEYCSGLTGDLVIPNSVTEIGVSTFEYCSGFTGDLVIPDSVTSIGVNAFNGCSGISNITIPNSVISIGNYAFYSTNTVRTRLTTENSAALNYNWTGSNRKLISDVTVTYHSNNADRGIAPVDNTVYETDDLITVMGNSGLLQKTGYFFQGWNTEADRSGTLYAPGETITAELKKIDLYAQWGSYVHITYNSNGADSGTVPVDDNTYKTGETGVLAVNTGNLSKTGLNFWGWNTEADGTGIFYLPGETITISDADIILYAQFGNKLSVTYTSTGNESGTVPVDNNEYLPGDTVVIMDGGNLAKTDYVLTGWNTLPDETGKTYAPEESIVIRDKGINLYAIWAEVTKWQAGDDIWAYAYKSKDGTYTLEFKGTGAMYSTWSYSTQPWNSIKSNIKNVIIGDGITTVGKRAFYDCTAIEKMVIGHDVSKIEDYAIYSTSAIKELVYPITLTTYGSLPFYNCTDPAMKVTITKGTGAIAASYTSIKNYTPWKISGTSNVTLEEGITNIPGYMFYSYAGEELTIPSTVKTISTNAFQYASSVKRVKILSLDASMETGCLTSNSVIIQAHNNSTAKEYADKKGNPFTSICEMGEDGVCSVCGYKEVSDGFTVKIPLVINMTRDANQFKGTADITVDYYMETKKVNISVADFYMTDNTGDKISVTGSVTGNGWHNGNTDATYNDVDGMYHGTSHVALTAPAKAGNYTGNLVFTITEENIGG